MDNYSVEDIKKYQENIFNNELNKYANDSFSEELIKSLKEWYQEIIFCGVNYIIFSTDSSYALFSIMQEITGIPIERSPSLAFLTPSSLLMNLDKFCNYYNEYGRFPTFSIVEDIYNNGRNMNRIFHMLENGIVANLKADTDVDLSNIKSALVRAIQLKVFINQNNNQLLDYRLRNKIVTKLKGINIEKYNYIADSISNLLAYSDEITSNSTFSIQITNKKELDLSKMIQTVFQGQKEYTDVQLFKDETGIKACATVRLLENKRNPQFIAIPFIFLPSLTEEEMQKLENQIKITLNDQVVNDYIDVLKTCYGPKTYYELLTLILSSMNLQRTLKKYNLEYDKKIELKQLIKLARNYQISGLSIEKTVIMLIRIIQLSIKYSASLESIINNSVKGEKHLNNKNIINDNLSNRLSEFWNINGNLNQHNDISLLTRSACELYIYKKNFEEELSVYNKKDDLIIYESNLPKEESIFEIVNNISHTVNYSLSENEDYTKYIISYLLHMIDLEIVNIISEIPSEINSIQICQCIKIKYPAKQLLAIQMYEYGAFIEVAAERARSKLRNIDEEIKLYFRNDKCKFTEAQKQLIINYLKLVEDIKKEISFEAYLDKIDVLGIENMTEEEFHNKKLKLLASRVRHRLDYLTNLPK